MIERAQRQNGSYGASRAALVKTSLLRNLMICDELEMLTPENLGKLKRGNTPTVVRGSYNGQIAELDHIVPAAEAVQISNELASLELPIAALNCAKGDKPSVSLRWHAVGAARKAYNSCATLPVLGVLSL